jgi:hypothetical protein
MRVRKHATRLHMSVHKTYGPPMRGLPCLRK